MGPALCALVPHSSPGGCCPHPSLGTEAWPFAFRRPAEGSFHAPPVYTQSRFWRLRCQGMELWTHLQAVSSDTLAVLLSLLIRSNLRCPHCPPSEASDLTLPPTSAVSLGSSGNRSNCLQFMTLPMALMSFGPCPKHSHAS